MLRYDVFLSHASADKPAVEHLAHKLREAGLEPFLDKWHLIPGEPWQEALEEALDQSRTCAVFLGKTLGPWQNEEMRSALESRVRDAGFRVIPVLLPGGKEPGKEKLPRFLGRLTWVDLRTNLDDEDAFRRLLAGIRGTAPGPGGEVETPALSYRCMAPAWEPFVQRSEYAKVRDALLADGSARSTTVGITTAIHGAGGFGKTALALELCYDAQVRAQYSDGILWTTMGEEIDAAGRLAQVRDLIRWWTEEEPPAFETVSAASAHLRQELNGKRVLLVVDDVWRPEDVTPFQGLDPRAALLATTRDSRTLPADSVPIHVDAMEIPEAVRLLGAGLPAGAEAELKVLAARLGEWPLLLKIVNRQLRELVQNDHLSLGLALREVEEALDAEGLTVFDREDLEARNLAVARTVGASLRRLGPEEINRFEQLAIFPEDKDIPLHVLEKLWGSGSFATKKLCERLYVLSLLLRFDRSTFTIRLHDVIRTYLLKKGESHLPEWHRRLLDACRLASSHWSDLPRDESYLWNHLIHHLIGAGQSDVCRALLLDFQYLRSKLEVTDISSLLADYSSFMERDHELRLVRDALRLSAHVLARNPAELREQLWGRLLGRQEAGIRGLLKKSEDSGTPWLRPRIASLPRPGGALIRTIEHPEVPNALVVLYDGQVVSGSAAGRLRVWSVENGTVLKVLKGHFISVLALGVLDSSRVVSSSADGRLGVWDVESGMPLQVLEGHSNLVFTVAALDSRRVVSGSADGTLRVWDTESGQTLQVLKGHSGGVHAVAVLDNHRVVSGSADRTLRVWDVESGQTLQVLRGHSDRVSAVASLNGRVVSVSGPFDGTLRVWDVKSGQTLHIFDGHSGGAHALAVLDGHRVVSGSADGMLRVCDVESGQTLQVLEGHSDKVHTVAPLDDRRVISGAADGTLRVWDVESRQALQLLEGSSRRINAISVLDSRRVVSGSGDRRLRVWDVESGRALQVLEEPSSPVTAVAVFGHHRVVSGSEDGTLRVWDLESGQALRRLDGHSRRVNAIAVLDSHCVVSGSSDRTLRVWDVASGRALQGLERHSNRVYTVAVLDSRRVVSGSVDGTLWVWDVENDRVLQVLRGLNEVNTLAVLDGRRVVSGSADGTLREWDVESGQTLQILPGHSGPVYALAVLDNRRVVFGSFDRTLRVWDLESRKVECLFRLDAPVTAIAVIRESRAIVAGDGSGRVHFFDYVDNRPTRTSFSRAGGGGARETVHRAENAPEVQGLPYFDPEDTKERSQAAALELEVSLERLSREDQERFAALAIFPEDAAVPLSILEKLWRLDLLEAGELSSRLYELSLLRDFDLDGGKIRVSGVIRAYLLTTWEPEIPKFHGRLLDACRLLHGHWWNLPREEQYLWWNLAHHLIGAGECASLRVLLFDFEYVQAKLQATDAFALVADYWALEADEELKVMQRTLALFAYDLAQDKSRLALQLLGRLLYRQESGIQHLLRGARRGAFWFRPKTPPSESSPHGITSLAALSRRRVVSGSSDGVIRVWDADGGETLHTLKGHTGRINRLAVLDEYRVVSGSNDGTVRLWNVESGEALRLFKGHTNRVNALAVLEGHRIASSSNDGTLRSWNVETGETRILEGHTGGIIALAALEGRRFVSGSDDATIRLWDVDRGGTLRTLRGHTGKVRALAVLDSHRIASGSDDGTVRLWNAESGEALCTMKGHFDSVRALSILSHQLIVSGSDDGTVRLWNVESGEALRCLEGRGWVRDLWALDERRIVASSQDGGIRLWNVESGLCLAFLNLGTAHPATTAFIPESETLVIGDMAGSVQFLGIESPEL